MDHSRALPPPFLKQSKSIRAQDENSHTFSAQLLAVDFVNFSNAG